MIDASVQRMLCDPRLTAPSKLLFLVMWLERDSEDNVSIRQDDLRDMLGISPESKIYLTMKPLRTLGYVTIVVESNRTHPATYRLDIPYRQLSIPQRGT